MPLSLEQIRELNKVTLYVTCCTDPVPVDGGGSSVGAPVWSLGMYSGGGFPLHGSVDIGPWDWAGMVNTKKEGGGWLESVGKILGNVGQLGFGLTPQLDMVQKMWLKSTEPLKFVMSCYLCLEESVEEDLLKPLSRLFFLTYPVRAVGVGEEFGEWGSTIAGEVRSLARGIEGSMGGGGLLAAAPAWVKGLGGFTVDGLSVLADLFEKAGGDGRDGFQRWFGEVYLLHCPPTFRSFLFGDLFEGVKGWLFESLGFSTSSYCTYGGRRVDYIETPGSGLTVCYGGSLISNCFIRDLDIKIPKLYYRGGYPGVVEVTITFETLRRGSANMYRDIIYGSADLK